MNEEKKKNGGPVQQAVTEEAPEQEVDRVDELLADVPEWLRGPLKENYRQILAGLAIIILTVSLWSGYSYYRDRQENAASYHLGIAMAKNSVDERIKALEDLRSRFSHTSAARLSRLLMAQAYMEKKDWKKAQATFETCASDFEGALGDSAVMGHGYALEQEKKPDQALQDYRKAEEAKRGFEAVAMLDRARVLSEEGRKKEALDAYDHYLDLKPKSPFLDFIRYEILKLS